MFYYSVNGTSVRPNVIFLRVGLIIILSEDLFAALRDDADASDHGDVLGYIDWITITVKRPNVYQLL